MALLETVPIQTKRLFLPSTAHLQDGDKNKAWVTVATDIPMYLQEEMDNMKDNEIKKVYEVYANFIIKDWNYMIPENGVETDKKLPITGENVGRMYSSDFAFIGEQLVVIGKEKRAGLSLEEKKN